MSAIKYKTGVCAECLNGIEVPLIARLCNFHYWKSRNKKPISKKPVKIAPISKKQAQRLKEYRKERDMFLKENNTCQFPGCASREVQLHHAEGRIGDNLTNRETFRALCFYHHRLVEENPALAKELNLSKSRLTA